MEREKQKKLDRERQLKEREERLEQQRLEDEEEAAAVAAGAMPKKSKFVSWVLLPDWTFLNSPVINPRSIRDNVAL